MPSQRQANQASGNVTVPNSSDDTTGSAEPDPASKSVGQVVAASSEQTAHSDPYRLASFLLVVGIVTTLVAVSSSWTSTDPTLHRLLDGPTNGWIPLLSSLLALAVYPRFRLGKWPATATVALVSFSALGRVLASQALDNFMRTWGWWVGLAGAGLLLAAAVITVGSRIVDRDQPRFQMPRTIRQLGGIAALIVVIFGLWTMASLLRVTESVSWPPAPGAITAEDAQIAAEEFAAENRHPFDIALEYEWSTAATIEAWPDGVEFFPRIFADIEGAESSVHIIMFGWKSGELGNEMANLVERKLAEGVEVRLLVDAAGSGPYDESWEMYEQLANAGAQIVVNDTRSIDEEAAAALSVPESDSADDEIGSFEHRKLYVIDGEVAWTGGAGIEDHFRNGEFHDVMIRVTGDVVRQIQAVFLTSFASHDAPLPDDLGRYFPEPANAGETPTAVVQTVPGGFASATQQVREMIDGAEQRLDIMNPYLTDEDIVGRVVAAAERGVDVRVLVSEESNSAAAQRATEHFYSSMIDAGVEIWEYPDAVVHAKVVVADDVVHVGTLNLDAWSLYRDFEVALVAESPAVAEMFRERIFGPDYAISTLATKPSGFDQRVNWMFYKLTWFL